MKDKGMKSGLLCLLIIAFFGLSGTAFPLGGSAKEFQYLLRDLDKRFAEYGWTDLKTRGIPWEYYRTTRLKRPLFFAIFGDPSKDCTLLFSAVHGDEIPTTYVLFKLADYLKENPDKYKGRCIVIAPLLNPDGFFARPSQRVNSNGIDLNRNFPTKDWEKDAFRYWEIKTHRNKRYYPGKKPGSENETRFQIALINRFKPHKILSLHSPLGFYDFDGPSFDLDHFEKWLEKISSETKYPMKKFGVFPGSLGNYAGLKRNIFVVTLELPSSNPSMAEQFYDKFNSAMTKFVALDVTGTYRFKVSD